MSATNLSEGPVQTGHQQTSGTPLTDIVEADLLQGLGALADLLNHASDTLSRGLQTIEDTLNAQSLAAEEWVPIEGSRSSIECDDTRVSEQTSQELVFEGVPMTILKLGTPASETGVARRQESEYQLGCSRVGDGWALVVRPAGFQPTNGQLGAGRSSDSELLRHAPLEIRLKAIREIPSLIRLLDSRCSGALAAAATSDGCKPALALQPQ